MTEHAIVDSMGFVVPCDPVQGLYSGGIIHLVNPQPEEINLVDIAHALSMLCRFGGHVKTFYSVAEHCIRVAQKCKPENRLGAILHDAAEAYLVDVPRPAKVLLKDYYPLEDKLARAIYSKFGVDEDTDWAEIKDWDNRFNATEGRELVAAFANPELTWHVEPIEGEIIVPQEQWVVEAMYYHLVEEYMNGN